MGFLTAWGRVILCAILFVAGLSVVVAAFKYQDLSDYSPLDTSSNLPVAVNDPERVYIRCLTNCSCESVPCEGFETIVQHFMGLGQQWNQSGTIARFVSYYSVTHPDQDILNMFYNKTMVSMFMTIEFADTGPTSRVVLQKAIDLSKSLTTDAFEVQIAGRFVNFLENEDTVLADMCKAAIFCIPTMIALLALQVRSWRLTTIPVVNTIVVLAITVGIICFLASKVSIPKWIFRITLCLTVALSMDHAFFYISRFQESRTNGNSVADAVQNVLERSGFVVSSLALIIPFVAMSVFGGQISRLGVCITIAVVVSIVFNTIMSPLLLLGWPRFFAKASVGASAASASCPSLLRATYRIWFVLVRSRRTVPSTPVEDLNCNTCYGKIARVISRDHINLLVMIVLCTLFGMLVSCFHDAKLSVGATAPYTSTMTELETRLREEFPQASISFASVFLTSPSTGLHVQSKNYYSAGFLLVRYLKQTTGYDAARFRGIMVDAGSSGENLMQVSWDVAKSLLDNSNGNESARSSYQFLYSLSVDNEHPSTSVITIYPPYDASGDKAKELMRDINTAFDEFNKAPLDSRHGFKLQAYHPLSTDIAAQKKVYACFTKVLCVTAVVSFCFFAVRFRSLFLPIRLGITVMLPILGLLGLESLLLEHKLLEWTGLSTTTTDEKLVWECPVCCTFVLMGLLLHQEIVLFTKYHEDLKEGLFVTDRQAIIHAVGVGGSHMVTARLVLALTFAGMALQQTDLLLSQISFTLVVGGFLDCFVVRALLVPSVLSLFGALNWWPFVAPRSMSGVYSVSSMQLRDGGLAEEDVSTSCNSSQTLNFSEDFHQDSFQ